MNKEVFATTILGLDKNELTLTLLMLDCSKNEQWGEIPGKNIRALLELTKESLFELLEKLLSKGIVRYSNIPLYAGTNIYLQAGKGFYVYNRDYRTWQPTEQSLYYKLCRSMGLRFSSDSYIYILDHYNIYAIKDLKVTSEEVLTPYELYDIFCQTFQEKFGREYRPTSQVRDLGYMKKVIFDACRVGLRDIQIQEFISWAVRVKSKDFKGAFLIGFLPLCHKDYLAAKKVEIMPKGFYKDENGQLRKQE
jgi:hypothetical protein